MCRLPFSVLFFLNLVLEVSGQEPPASAWTEGPQPVLPIAAANINAGLQQHPTWQRALTAGDSVPQVTIPWSGTTVQDLHNEYWNIFPSGNRNAASHLWSRFILERSTQMSKAVFETMFAGFCPVSGSPVTPSQTKTYSMMLESATGSSSRAGFMYFCCQPCVCDTNDFIKVDTKRVVLKDEERLYHFTVIGNPCIEPEKLNEMHDDPFGRGQYSLARSAPDLKCKDGMLEHAALSDNGYVIIGLLHDDAPFSARKSEELTGYCQQRAEGGYASGMGTIFRLAAGLNVIASHSQHIEEEKEAEEVDIQALDVTSKYVNVTSITTTTTHDSTSEPADAAELVGPDQGVSEIMTSNYSTTTLDSASEPADDSELIGLDQGVSEAVRSTKVSFTSMFVTGAHISWFAILRLL